MQAENYQKVEICKKISTLLKQRGMKQKDLAAALQLHPVQLSRKLSGSRAMDDATLNLILAYLQTSSAEILDMVIQDKKLPETTPSEENWKARALAAEAKLKHLQRACTALGQHVQALGITVDDFARIISE